jgi:hypothetical protein
MLELITYKTEKGLYLANKKWSYNKQRESIPTQCLINGVVPVISTFKNDWYFLPDTESITKVTKLKNQGYETTHWALKDESAYIKGVVPKSITLEESCEYFDDGEVYDWCIGSDSKYYLYRNLYEQVRKSLPPVEETVEYSVEDQGFIQQELVNNDYSCMKVSVLKDPCWAYQGQKELDLSKVVHYYELEELLTPDLLLHNRPCYITADQTYEIVRNHIKNNINPKYARITSDYNFCFTVKKNIQIKPFIRKTEITKSNGKSYAKPKFNTNKIEYKQVELFEMCPSKPYRDYTCIKGFKGASLSDLVENMKLYLEELMEVINAPVAECQHCNGTGHTFDKVTNINERGE